MLTSKHFLQIGGVVLLVVAVLGFVGVIGPTPEKSIFGAAWYFDPVQNWAHLLIGIFAVTASAAIQVSLQRQITLWIGVLVILIGLLSIFRSSLLGAGLESPTDTFFYVILGIWALASSKKI